MTSLIIAALFLLATHIGISSTGMRPRLIAALGERVYRILYSLISLIAIVWLVTSWRAAPWVELWPSGPAVRHLPFLIMPFALLMVVCGVSQPNPTAMGAAAETTARGILRVTRHPVMWGIALWALVHLLANGDLASVLFFATFVVLALVGMAALDRKQAARDPGAWQRLRDSTSALPLVAIVQGRQRLALAEIGWARIGIALALYGALILLHPWLFGVSVLTGA